MSLPENDLILGLISTTTGVVLYTFSYGTSKVRFPLFKLSWLDPEIRNIYRKRLGGFIFLGVLPGVLMLVSGARVESSYGLSYQGISNMSLPIIAIALVILVITFINSQSKNNLKVYPQIRKKVWSASMLGGSTVTWMLYLLAYEFLFRGILLFSSLEILDQSKAIGLNLAFYSIFHLQKGLKEILASIPFGLILCLLAINSGSIWPAYFLHVELALCTEWLSIYFNPDITLNRSS